MRNQYKILAEKYEEVGTPLFGVNVKEEALRIIKSRQNSKLDPEIDPEIAYKYFVEWMFQEEGSIQAPTTAELQALFDNDVENFEESQRDREEPVDIDYCVQLAQVRFGEILRAFLKTVSYKERVRAYHELFKNNPGVNIDI